MEACNLEAKMMGTSLSVGKTTHLQIGSHIFVHASNKTEKLEASVLEKMKVRGNIIIGILFFSLLIWCLRRDWARDSIAVDHLGVFWAKKKEKI